MEHNLHFGQAAWPPADFFNNLRPRCDPAAQSINVVLDFGGAGLGDPVVDFAGIMSPVAYGESFLRRCFRVYPEIEAVMDRARFYVGTFALEEALFGIEHDDPAALEAGMEDYV